MEKLQSLMTRFQNLPNKKKMKALEITFVIIVSISLFAGSLAIKNSASNWYENEPGIGFNWVRENDTWYFESYADSWWYYEPYLLHFRYENWNPYAGGEGPLNGYAYGPMFLYGMYFISLFVGLFNPGMDTAELVKESVKWTHITFDALCVVMIYVIIILLNSFKDKQVKKHTFGILGAAIFTFMPFNLLYVDSVYLNTPQMTFFTLLSLLFFMKDKYMVGAFFLSIAWLSKQMPLFLLIPWFMIVWKKKSLRDAFMRYLFPFLLSTLVLSLPWIIMTPRGYLWRVFGPGRPLDFVELGRDQFTVTLAHSFLYFGNAGLANFYVIINKYMIPFLLFYALATIFSYFNGEKIGNNETSQIIFTTWMIINTHLFISRGVYKYYNAFITPFVVLSLLSFTDDNVQLLFKKIWRNKEKGKQFALPKETESKDKEVQEISDEAPKNVYYTITQFAAILMVFLGLSALFYYFNWALIAKIRYLHPMFLLILFVFFSILLPPSMYLSLVKKSNYVMIKEDVIYIAKETYKGIQQTVMKTTTTTVNTYMRTKEKIGKLTSKNRKEEKAN